MRPLIALGCLVLATLGICGGEITLVSRQEGLALTEYRSRLALCVDPHTTTLSGADSAALCVCEPGFTLQNGVCAPCAAGLFKPDAGDDACLACPSGSTSLPASVSSSECVCQSGKFSEGGACVSCAVGTYKPFTGNGSCPACQGTMTTLGSGSTSLEDCLCREGHFGSAGGAVDGSGCSECPEDSYKTSIGSATQCTNCPDNSLTVDTGNTAVGACLCGPGWTGVASEGCTACAEGTYKDAAGPADCQPCPVHSVSPPTSNTLADCACMPGFTGADPSACVACVAGTFKGNAGSEPCQQCAVDTFSGGAAVSCTGCGLHLEAEAGQSRCQCSAGFFSDGVGPCQPCVAGTFKAGPGNASSLCLPCADNTYTAGGAASCSDCPAHSITSTPGGIYDCLCQPGYKRVAADTCQACPAGTFKEAAGNSGSCEPCAPDTYQPDEASQSCLVCSTATGGVSSTYDATGALAIASCECTAGFERTADVCVTCSGNYYCPGRDGKVACPVPGGLAPSGSDEEGDCYCEAGYYWSTDSGAACAVCPENHFCVEGTVTPEPCTQHSYADEQSTSADACVCVVGYEPGN